MTSATVTTDEAAIRALVDELTDAIRTKNVDRVMAHCDPSLVTFDIMEPLQYKGLDTYRKGWEMCFGMMDGDIDYEVRELTIHTSGDVAFSHSLNHLKGKTAHGSTPDSWFRVTAGYRKINGEWKSVHEHVSFPADMKCETAKTDLKP